MQGAMNLTGQWRRIGRTEMLFTGVTSR